MVPKLFALLVPLLLLLGTYGDAALPSQGCVWADLNVQDCDTKACPHDFVVVGTGKAGSCSPDEARICQKGRRKLCCPRTLQLRNCQWQGTAPICRSACPRGQMALAEDAWGSGSHCTLGCKNFCCEVLS